MTLPLFPFRFQPLGRTNLLVSDAGDFLVGSEAFLERMVAGTPLPEEHETLLEQGFAYLEKGDFYWSSFQSRLLHRKTVPAGIRHVLAIPTLRCDLSCGYCQAARAKVDAPEMDWTTETESAFQNFLSTILETPGRSDDAPLVVEFQGGEPTLRLDTIARTLTFLDERAPTWRIVICTNLNQVTPDLLTILAHERVLVSTSVDGPSDIQQRNRTETPEATKRFYDNFRFIRDRFGPDKISALPTILPHDHDRLPEIIDTYRTLGLDSLFLRPVSPHGFARTAGKATEAALQWHEAYRRALDVIFTINAEGGPPIREYGLEVALRRIIWPNFVSFVDLRSPAPVARDAIVIDHDGALYPSDEARMLARLRRIDLRIGTLWQGIDRERVHRVNWNQMGEVNEDCIHCAYQPFCGIDTVDDLARYDRIDLPRAATRFCQSHMSLFTIIFDMLAGAHPRDLINLSGHLTGRFEAVPFFGPCHHD